MAKVFKARYFPYTTVESTKLRSYPSLTWRSIIDIRGLIERGMGWRIGGVVVNIWNDSWIPRPRDGRINCQNININYTIVNQLINLEHCTWKEDIIRAITDEDQASSILNIPLAKSKQ